jgi:hypothetical protein
MSSRREVATVDQPRRRYASSEPQRPDEVSDPHTTEDETKRSLSQRLRDGTSKWGLIAGTLLVVAIVGYGVLLGGELIVDVLTNTYLQAILAAAAVFGAGAMWGGKREWRTTIAGTDTLSVHLPDGTREYLCEYVETGEDPAVRLYAGRSGLFRSMNYLTVEEVSTEFPRLDAKSDRDGTDPAVVALPRTYTETALTDRGITASVLTDGLSATPYASRIDFEFRPPSTAHEDDLKAANDTIHELKREERSLRRQLGATMNRVQNMIQESKQSRADIRSDLVDLYQELREADRPARGRSRRQEQTDDGLGEPNPALWNGGEDS